MSTGSQSCVSNSTHNSISFEEREGERVEHQVWHVVLKASEHDVLHLLRSHRDVWSSNRNLCILLVSPLPVLLLQLPHSAKP